MRIFKTKVFIKFAKGDRLSDSMLCEAIERAENGLIDADLGGFVIKQRVAREGQGKSKGYRVLIAFKNKKRSIFIYGFAKNEKDNISDRQLETMKEIATMWLNLDEKMINLALKEGKLTEIKYEKKN